MLTTTETTQTPEGISQMVSLTIEAVPVRTTIAAQNLPNLVTPFLNDALERGATAGTLYNYNHQLAPFLKWWSEIGSRHDNLLTAPLLAQFPRWLRRQEHRRGGRGLAAATVYIYAHRARHYLHWLYHSERMSVDISQWLPVPPKPRGKKPALPPADVKALVDTLRRRLVYQGKLSLRRVRDMTLVCFMLETAARQFEAAEARWENVAFLDGDRGYVFLEDVKGYLGIDLRRTVVFGPATGRLLRVWGFLTGAAKGPIFPLRARGVHEVVLRVARAAGLHCTSHDLRRTWATHFAKTAATSNKYYTERLIDCQLGHQPETMTERHYIDVTHLDVLRHYVSPLDGLDFGSIIPTHAGR